jgi:UDP-N-acetylglucosamine 4,6-dehydratase
MKSVIVTGGTGSFGRAFVRYLLAVSAPPDRIRILSRGEHAQAEMAAEMAPLDRHGRLGFFIGDVRDKDRLRRAFTGCDTVVHAAALKRIEVGQYNPAEMVKTNVLGAMNVIEAATDAGVAKVVALSTDKAWQPISPYGHSKALAEALFLNANNARGSDGPRFAVTRYGNVAGSNGSVIPKWRTLLAGGAKRVPVTDPGCTRFWMTIHEAVFLVLDTIRNMRGGELAIPTLPAYRLGDLAEAMGAEMDIIGLPSFEKRHEGMADGKTSDIARRMTVGEIRERLTTI